MIHIEKKNPASSKLSPDVNKKGPEKPVMHSDKEDAVKHLPGNGTQAFSPNEHKRYLVHYNDPGGSDDPQNRRGV